MKSDEQMNDHHDGGGPPHSRDFVGGTRFKERLWSAVYPFHFFHSYCQRQQFFQQQVQFRIGMNRTGCRDHDPFVPENHFAFSEHTKEDLMNPTERNPVAHIETYEENRLTDAREHGVPWKKWGPY